MSKRWFKLFCRNQDLQLIGTLNGGQSFRWKKDEKQNQWTGVFSNKVWILQQEQDVILYKVYESKETDCNSEEYYNDLLRQYFQLDIDLESYYLQWSGKDPNFKEAAKQFYGIRILKQDITENIFSFICSQNNHISRISSMVEKLAQFYGEKICNIDDKSYYAFPNVNALAGNDIELKLRENGFGYRAKYISNSAAYIVSQGGQKWLDNLKLMTYDECKKNLMSLMGIGAKVADCICLMSLGHLDAIPVDTHIYQIAARLYMPELKKQKTVTDKIYNEIGEYFRNLYGPLAGWAHTILFCADLKKFQNTENVKKLKPRKRKLN
ncbi:hypothetical protein GWI33_019228 [Rhynchophorus ferrugineus]|uniref:N-glycosylase/DNA lyase n=1 Tax=Rhynchophorus ferrugineus TaxID=354439 RepID=A0A834HUV1_RHYFE|nr:hypothetical protein GWI33_019228 [Rhynchophorus ferrugineus]